MTDTKNLSVGYDVSRPDPDVERDPINVWYATGEDIGLPKGWVAKQHKLEATILAEELAFRAARSLGAGPRYTQLLVDEARRAVEKAHGKPRMGLVGIGATPADIDAFISYLKGSSERLYDPGEPRRPKGDPQGGQWTSGGGAPGSGTSADLVKQGLAGGFSYRPFGGAPNEGFMVSPYKNAELALKVEDFTREAVIKYRTEHADLLGRPDHYFGGWLDNGHVYLDVSVRSPTLKTATALARKHKQLGIYDVGAGNTIYIDSKAA